MGAVFNENASNDGKCIRFSETAVRPLGRDTRGVRSMKDFEYERQMADVNRQLTGIETVFLPASPQLASLSSSLLRELSHFGHDISAFLPKY